MHKTPFMLKSDNFIQGEATMKIKKINKQNFRHYGRLIEHRGNKPKAANKNLFSIVLREKGKFGWRIAYLTVKDKTINRLEQHLTTFESFEPVSGKAMLYLCRTKNPKDIECFRLDRPIILDKGVWHGVTACNGKAEIKITENANVRSIYWPLGFSL